MRMIIDLRSKKVLIEAYFSLYYIFKALIYLLIYWRTISAWFIKHKIINDQNNHKLSINEILRVSKKKL